MEENIKDIKRNIKEIGQEITKASIRAEHGKSNLSELFIIREKVWNIQQYIDDIETFI